MAIMTLLFLFNYSKAICYYTITSLHSVPTIPLFLSNQKIHIPYKPSPILFFNWLLVHHKSKCPFHYMCGIIICGIYTKTKETSKPANLPNPPDNIVCPFCTFRGKTRFNQKVSYFTLFFIPIFPVKYNEPYVACPCCGIKLGRFGTEYCKKCRTATSESYSHCVRCGCNLNENDNRVKT